MQKQGGAKYKDIVVNLRNFLCFETLTSRKRIL